MSNSCAKAKAPTVTAIALARPVPILIQKEGREIELFCPGATGN